MYMRKTLLFFMMTSLYLFGRYDAAPIRTCAAYNDMKHSKNTHDVHIDPSRVYTVLKHHKGQKLVLVRGEQPVQRWVDGSCFGSKGSKEEVTPATTFSSERTQNRQLSTQNLLALSWHNAFCETHRYKKECKRKFFGTNGSDDNFVLHGLWPQPRNKVYCGVQKRYIIADRHKQWDKLPEPKLSLQTKKALKSVMPGVNSNLHRHEWIKHGTCYGSDAETYFRDAITLTRQVQRSQVATFFRKYAGKRVTLQRIRELFDGRFGKGTGSRVELRCNRGMISELWLHLGGHGTGLSQLLQKGKKVHSQCQRGIIDRAGYGR